MIEYAKILKANPYHDGSGRFASENSASFVSVGGVFDRQREMARTAGGGGKARSLTKEQINAEFDAVEKMGLMEDTVGSGLREFLHTQSNGTFSPMGLAKAMYGDSITDVQNRRTFSLSRSGNGVYVSIDNAMIHGAAITRMRRSFDFETGDAHHSYLALKEGDQGGGAVKKLFKAAVPEYERMGMKQITLKANLDVGGYAWAKYGFEDQYANTTNNDRISTVNSNMRLDKSERNAGTDAETMAVTSMMTKYKNDPKLVQLIADMKTPEIDKARAGYYSKPTSVGKSALMGSSWNGVLKLDDKDARARLNKYIGA